VARANGGGAEYSPCLRGPEVILLPDNDEAGRKHVAQVGNHLRGIAARVRVLALPGFPEKADIADWVANGGTAAALAELVANAPDFQTTAHRYETKPEPSPNPAASLDGFDLTEDGIGLAFAKAHQDLLRYDHSIGRWFQWTGKAWRQDETRLAFSWARRTCRQLANEAGAEGKLLVVLAKAATAAAVERFAQSDPALAVTSAIWDSDPFLLGTPSGTLDLRTGELRDTFMEDFITKLTSVTPSVMPDCPSWRAFLGQVTQGNAGLILFLKQWCGYCLTGDIREHALVFAHGPGSNGKGVFLNVVRSIMGNYARNAAMDTFTASHSDKHPTDLAMLRGARMVTASETEEGRAWAEARIKALTGGDPITARFMRQDFFEFHPTFKLTIVGNHKPVLRNVDAAARRRINMVPFLYKPPIKDKELEAKLLKEAPGILRWMIEGCLYWQENGLTRPDIVVQATAEYFSEQDTVHKWMEETCLLGATQSDTLAVLFKSWSDYALANGERPGTTKWFTQTLARLGCEAVKHTPGNHGKRGFKGIGIKPIVTRDRTEPYHHDAAAD
jgi:putative DNA primase/helicase